jgi:NTP pyrophosphatase (non-canonical NTP hydrolase)
MEHPDMVAQLAKPGSDILTQMHPNDAHLVHMVLGIAGEVGELVDAIKKHAIYGKALDLENCIEELGDLEFYLEGLRQGLGIEREETVAHNIKKLGKRYENWKYTNEQAIARADKNG